MYKQEDLILLNMAGIGKAALEKLSKSGLQRKLAAIQKEHNLDAELRLIKKYKVDVMTIFDANYPKLLKEIHSPPIVLYSRGKPLEEDEIMVAVVGSRLASAYGIVSAERLGYELASRGVVVVSGLARGIDSASHRGALKAHGRTVAVLGNGLKTVYPPENKKLAEEIAEKGGAVVSEFPIGTPAIGRNFPRRNRVISGLSLGVIVVEASRNSGALITADFAAEQDREVFAVPGKMDSPTSFGTNELIRQGARLIQNVDDVTEELGLRLSPPHPGPLPKGEREKLYYFPKGGREDMTAEEERIYKNLSTEPRYIDEVTEAAKFPLSKTLEILFGLQVKKLVKELPGKYFVKV